MLRVGVPEIGLIFLPLALPLAHFSAKSIPRPTWCTLALLLTMIVIPWIQAGLLASGLEVEWKKTFRLSPTRFPLLLGSTSTSWEMTEEYKKGRSWDRYIPEDVEVKARVLFIHGGSWRNGTRKDYPEIFQYLAGRGYEVVSISYALSGEAPYPAGMNDLSVAVDKLSGMDDVPLFLMGRSSGGHMALLASYQNADKVSGVVGIYAPVDMTWSYENPSNPNVLDSEEAIVEFLEFPPNEAEARYREASPIEQISTAGPPTLLIHGQADCLVYHRQSEMLSERLEERGVSHFLLSLPWMEHGGDITLTGPTGRISAWTIEAFLDSVLTDEAHKREDGQV